MPGESDLEIKAVKVSEIDSDLEELKKSILQKAFSGELTSKNKAA